MVDYPVADPAFASLDINPGAATPMSQVGWEKAGPSAAFIVNGEEVTNDVPGKKSSAKLILNIILPLGAMLQDQHWHVMLTFPLASVEGRRNPL